jgi:hypothetical protein
MPNLLERMGTGGFWGGPGSLWGSLSGQVSPSDVARDMTYQVDQTGLNFANRLDSSVSAQNQRGANYDQMAGNYFKQASQALDPTSGYNRSILGMINAQSAQQSADTLAQQNMMQQRNMAMQGGGASGIQQATARQMANQAGGQLAQQQAQNNLGWMSGLSGRAAQIAGIGQGMAGIAGQAYGQAGNLQGMQGSMYGQYAGQQNQMMANRAEGVAQANISNRQNSANLTNSLIGGLGALAMAPVTGGGSLLGYGINTWLNIRG